MRLAAMPDDGLTQWMKILIPASGLVAVAVLVCWRGLLRPAWTRFSIYLLDHEDGRAMLKALHEKTMMDLHSDVAQTKSSLRTMQERFSRFEERQEEHSVAIQRIEDNVRHVPAMTDALERLTEAVEENSKSNLKLSEVVARIEGREEERRFHHETGSPRRRRSD